ncbi:MerR family transcriptional regulator [Streptomyces cheonanensis]|uniref:MerR family transcriptional regulator n=1 Tax=Streptomyces cheonanensis TaxID=312720 RepID=A0ABP5GR08_9ACTN
MDAVRIGELARRTGVSVRALRYYEEQRLLTSERSSGGQRHYPESAEDRVLLIQQLYAAGLSSRVILDLLPCVVSGEADPGVLDRLAAERRRIDEQITSLIRTRERMDQVIGYATTSATTGHACPRPGRSQDPVPARG